MNFTTFWNDNTAVVRFRKKNIQHLFSVMQVINCELSYKTMKV